MSVNPKSLQNLTPGSNKPFRKLLTKQVQAELVDYLMSNFDEFTRRMASLNDRDYAAAYIKMMSLVTPRRTDVTLDATDTPAAVDWTINVVPRPRPN